VTWGSPAAVAVAVELELAGVAPCSPCGGRRQSGSMAGQWIRADLDEEGVDPWWAQQIWSSVVAEVDGGSKAAHR
jgi:hypothetical protein